MVSVFPAWADEIVATFSGEGPAVTDVFTVQNNWEVRWDAEGRQFELVVKSIDRGIPSVAASQVEPGPGLRNYIQGGRYYFEVQANGPWRVEVRQK